MSLFTHHLSRAACVAASAFALCSPAHAVSATVTVYSGDAGCFGGDPCVTLSGGGANLSLPSVFLKGLSASGVAPGIIFQDADSFSVGMPIQSVTGLYEWDASGQRLTVTKLASVGGVRFSQIGAESGPSLALTSFKVDMLTNSVYASVVRNAGLPDQVIMNNQRLMTYGITLGDAVMEVRDGDVWNEFVFSDLALTQDGLDVFRQVLQLGEAGSDALSLRGASLTFGYGLSIEGFSALVPEPATWTMMGLGLAGLVCTRRRGAAMAAA